LKQGKELEQESTEKLMELETIDRSAEEDIEGEKMDTIGVTAASDASSTLIQTKDIDTTYEHKDEPTETTSHSDIECEENQNSTRIAGKKTRQQLEDTAVREIASAAMEEYPPLTPMTDDEQELVRPPYTRKKKQRTEVDTSVERREGRSSRYRRI
jgi:hypothetical protein